MKKTRCTVDLSLLDKYIEKEISFANGPLPGQKTVKKKAIIHNRTKFLETFENSILGKIRDTYLFYEHEMKKKPTVIFVSENFFFYLYYFHKVLVKNFERIVNLFGCDVYIHREGDNEIIFGFEPKDFNPIVNFTYEEKKHESK